MNIFITYALIQSHLSKQCLSDGNDGGCTQTFYPVTYVTLVNTKGKLNSGGHFVNGLCKMQTISVVI